MRTRSVGPRFRTALAVVLLATVIGGCADVGRQPTGGGGGGGSSTPGAKGIVGDQVTVAVQAPATGVNPSTVNTAFNAFALLAYEPLIYKGGGKLQPALAESWKIEEGNMALQLTLRKGVKFADGDPVTAESVKKSLDYCRSKESPQNVQMITIGDVVVVDESHVTIKFKTPNPMADEMMTQGYGCGMIISPKGLANVSSLTVDNPSAGAGAYIYDPKQSVAGDHYTYTANPDYYDKAKQHYKKVVLRVIANPQAALNALTTKQVDMTVGGFTTAEQAKAAGVNITWTAFVWQGLNLIDRNGETTKALGDVRVRQAINYAIDREAISKALLKEYGVPTVQPAAEGFDMHSEAARKKYPYDPAKAKQLMAEAGYKDGFDLPIMCIKFAGFDLMMQAMEPYLKEIGVRPKVTMATDEKTYIGGMTSKQYSAVVVGYGSQPSYIMAQGLIAPTALPFNGFGTKDPKVSEYIDQISRSKPEERAKVGAQLTDYLVDQAWFAPVVFVPVFYYSRDGLGGTEVNGKQPTLSILDVHNTK